MRSGVCSGLARLRSASSAELACLVAALSYGISYIYMSRFLAGTRISTLALSAGQLGIGSAITAALVAAVDRSLPEPDPPATLAVTVLGVFCTGLAYLLNYRIIRDDGATAASVVTYLLPVVAIIVGALVLNEPITTQTLAGTAIILAGVVLTRGHRPAARR